MLSNNIVYLLNHYFNNNDFAHFVKIMTNIDINYNDYLKCIMKDDILKISKNVLKDIKSNESKKDLVELLSEHFSNHDFKYFISKISNIEKNINYNAYLKCLSTKNIESIAYIVSKIIVTKLDNDLDKPFNSKRQPFEIDNISTFLLLHEDNEEVNYYFKRLNKLFKNEIMRVNGTNNNLLDIKITEDINSNSDSFSTLYFGKIIDGIINEKVDVFIKSQPVIPERLSKFRRYYEYQIPHEVYVMNNINKKCYDSITAKIYGYGKIKGLIEGDIDRYILVTEKLDSDIDIVIKEKYSVNFIKNLCINILNALQTIHSCNLNEFVSFVHCDIKPNNIVFTNDSKNPIKIIDFGLTLNVFNNKKKRDLELLNIGGSDVYMSISQHDDDIVDYMFDFQAIAWMLLLFLGFNIKPFLNDIYNFKIKFVKNYYKDEFINKIETDRLTRNNILVIGELCNYTINRADKKDRYSTDKKTTNGYYCDYNEQYYIDFKNILNKLK